MATNTHQLDEAVVHLFWKVRVAGAGGEEEGGAHGKVGEEAARKAPETLAEAGVVGAGAASDDDAPPEVQLAARRGDRYGNMMNACRALAERGRANPTAYLHTMEGIEDLFEKLRMHAVKKPVGRPPGDGMAAPLAPPRQNVGRGTGDKKRKKQAGHK
jgi:hypothetical protein